MAIYEYQCESCGTVFEVSRPISRSGEPAACTACGGPGRKLVSGFAATQGYGIKGMAKQPLRAPSPPASDK